MPRYNVRFTKAVCNDTGHGCVTYQGDVDIDADDENEAIRLAKGEFCRQRRIPHWTFHADAIELVKRGAARKTARERPASGPVASR